jgi:imidazolonepropionase-like amidohydrolase
VVKLFARRPFFIIPTLLVKQKTIESNKEKGIMNNWLETERAALEVYKLYKQGVIILAGTDAPNNGINFGDDLYKEISYFIKAGFTSIEALRTATSLPAKVFRLNDRGTIAAGKRADLILLNGDLSTGKLEAEKVIGIWKKGQRVK